MTKKKNKDTKSAFYFFMLDYKTNAEKAGRKFPNGLADVQQQCAPDWNVRFVFILYDYCN